MHGDLRTQILGKYSNDIVFAKVGLNQRKGVGEKVPEDYALPSEVGTY